MVPVFLYRAIGNKDLETIKFLISKGVNLNSKKSNPLIMATKSGFSDVVKILIENGADPNVVDSTGNTPLHMAVETDNFELIDVLLSNSKTKINVCNDNGDTVYSLARDSGITRTVIKLMEHHQKHLLETSDTLDEDTLRFMQDCKSVKEAGHILGMSTFIKVRKPNSTEFTEIQTDLSNSTLSSITSLTDHLKQFRSQLNTMNPDDQELSENLFEMIDALEFEQSYLKFDGTVNEQDILNRYKGTDGKEGRFTTIHSGFSQHDITLALDQDLFIIGNRGAGKGISGTIVNKLDSSTQKLITAEFIAGLNPVGRHRPSQQEMTDRMKPIQTDPMPLYLPSKDQKFSNCTMVNAKAVMQALFYSRKKRQLSNLLKLHNKNDHTEPIIVCGIKVDDESSIEKAAQKYAHVNFKRVTSAIRDIKIGQLIQQSNNFTINKKLYYYLVKNYLLEHHGQHKQNAPYIRFSKIQTELLRERVILSKLDPDLRKQMILDLDQAQVPLLTVAIQNRDKELINILLEGGIDPNKPGPLGQNYLILAILSGDTEVIEKLLKNGANPSTPDAGGLSAESFAKQNNIIWVNDLFDRHSLQSATVSTVLEPSVEVEQASIPDQMPPKTLLFSVEPNSPKKKKQPDELSPPSTSSPRPG